MWRDSDRPRLCGALPWCLIASFMAATPRHPSTPHPAYVICGGPCVKPSHAPDRSLAQIALKPIGGEPKAIDIDWIAANRTVRGQFRAQHDQIVIVTEPGSGAVEGTNVASNTGIASFEES